MAVASSPKRPKFKLEFEHKMGCAHQFSRCQQVEKAISIYGQKSLWKAFSEILIA
jgi:hypothetical protein